MLALVDGNSFYASCEQIFRPDLQGKPVVVLSNNDGCIVARNKEAKALGVPDLEPFFKHKDFLERHQVHIFSSNYELYGDISRRMMNLLGSMVGDIEIYSIDECFLRLLPVTGDYPAFGQSLKNAVLQQIGMPTCVGIAPTKTLAKMANKAAKRIPRLNGVCAMSTVGQREWVMKRLAASEVWGVGRRISARLTDMGIHTALDLARADPKHLRKQFSVVLERTIRELNGEACIALDQQPQAKKEIVSSRSFSHKIYDSAQLQQAVCQYAGRACEKLRAQDGLTDQLWVFVESSRFSGTRYANQRLVKLEHFTNDTAVISQAARTAAAALFRPGIGFHKCGVGLLNLKARQPEQLHFFTAQQSNASRRKMAVLDAVNQKYGRGTLALANQGIDPGWKMARNMRSPAYTTRWTDLPRIVC